MSSTHVFFCDSPPGWCTLNLVAGKNYPILGLNMAYHSYVGRTCGRCNTPQGNSGVGGAFGSHNHKDMRNSTQVVWLDCNLPGSVRIMALVNKPHYKLTDIMDIFMIRTCIRKHAFLPTHSFWHICVFYTFILEHTFI